MMKFMPVAISVTLVLSAAATADGAGRCPRQKYPNLAFTFWGPDGRAVQEPNVELFTNNLPEVTTNTGYFSLFSDQFDLSSSGIFVRGCFAFATDDGFGARKIQCTYNV